MTQKNRLHENSAKEHAQSRTDRCLHHVLQTASSKEQEQDLIVLFIKHHTEWHIQYSQTILGVIAINMGLK